MDARCKTKRNQKIWELYEKGWAQVSIARMFKMKPNAVFMVISREKIKRLTDAKKI